MLKLTVITGSGESTRYALPEQEGTPIRLGRSEECEISLPGEVHLSRIHCLLTIINGKVLLQDNHSSNGIAVHGQRIDMEIMVPGQDYQAATCKLRLEEVPKKETPPSGNPPAIEWDTNKKGASSPPTAVRPALSRPKRKAASAAKKKAYLSGTPGSEWGLPYDFELCLRLPLHKERLAQNDLLHFGITPSQTCYIYMVQYDSTGSATLIVPGIAGVRNKVFGHAEMMFPPLSGEDYEFIVEAPFGQDTVIALACTQSCPFPKIWKQCYEATDRLRQPGQVELQALQECLKQTKKAQWSSAILRLETFPS